MSEDTEKVRQIEIQLLDKVRDLIHDLAHDTGLSDDDIRILDGLDKIQEELNHE